MQTVGIQLPEPLLRTLKLQFFQISCAHQFFLFWFIFLLIIWCDLVRWTKLAIRPVFLSTRYILFVYRLLSYDDANDDDDDDDDILTAPTCRPL